VVVLKVLLKVIVEEIVSPEPVLEPLILFPIESLPLPSIKIAALDDVQVPDWFALKSACVDPPDIVTILSLATADSII